MRRLALLALLLPPGPALADRPFVLPATTSLSAPGVVTFDAAGADHVFFFDHRPLGPETIRVTRPDGAAGEAGAPTRLRTRTVFDVRLDQPGTWRVASEQTQVTGSFRLNGEERRVGGRGPAPAPGGPATAGSTPAGPASAGDAARRPPPVALADLPADATDLDLTEQVSRAETFVTVGAPSDAALRPAARGLALAPITHPNALVAGQPARFRLLIDGRPAAGLPVTVVADGDRWRDEEGAQTLTADPDGVVVVRWPHAGRYWLGAELRDYYPAEPRARARRLSYSATLEVATP